MEITGLLTMASLNNHSFSYCSTIGELPGFDIHVTNMTLTRSVVAYFEANPDLPAVIVKNGAHVGVLSRKDFFQHLSRPFALDLFLSRPLLSILDNILLKKFYISASTSIEDAIILALKRPITEIYDPILVIDPAGQHYILDFHTLLIAQTQLLHQANRFIRQQVETSQALSHLMSIQEVLEQILVDLAKMIPFHYGTILLFDQKNNYTYPAVTFTTWPDSRAEFDPVYNNRFYTELLATRQPKLIAGTLSGEDRFVMPRAIQFDSWLGFPFVYSNRVIGLLSLVRLQTTPLEQSIIEVFDQVDGLAFGKSDIDLITSLSTTFTAAIRNAQLLSELHSLAETDPLTNTLNRRGFFAQADQGIQRAEKDTHFAVLILDIDHFKRVNDEYGHQIGDMVIQTVAGECKRQMRQTDLIGRYGGEEFVLLLTDTDAAGAGYVADRIRASIAKLKIEVGIHKVSVTVSIGGVAFLAGAAVLTQVLQQADEALYKAKSMGRNRCLFWTNDLGEEDHSGERSADSNSKDLILKEPVIELAALVRKEDLENESVLGLVQALEMREKEDHGHAQRVAGITLNFARLVNIDEDEIPTIYRGALLHDIGKIAIPDRILLKTGKLSAEEWETMRKHPEYALQLLSSMNYLKDSLDIPFCHHEKWNGSGYPRGLAGKAIPLSARLFAIVDVWVALTADRCYRKAWPVDQVVNHIIDQSGRHFDPELVDLFLDNLTLLTGVKMN